jgi:hypothetical protein
MYFVVMPRVSLIVILVMYVHYLYSVLPNCNLFTQHALFILWRDTTSELWTPVQFPLHSFTVLLLLALFTLLAILLSYYHSIRSFLCLQQTGEIDNLIVSWEQSTCLCYAGFTLLLGEDMPTSSYIWRPCPECHEASMYHLLKFGFLLLVRLNLDFITEGRPATVLIIPSSWGSQRAVLTSHQAVFLAPLPGNEEE